MASRTTALQRSEFLGAYKLGGTIGKACEASGISRHQYHHLLRTDDEFRIAFEDAKEWRVEEVEDVIRRAAVEKEDLRAALEYMKMARPEAWQPRVTVDATDRAVEMSRNEALASVAQLGKELAQRREELEMGVIEV